MQKLAMRCVVLVALFLVGTSAQAFDSWVGGGPFATGQGNRIVNTLAVSADGMTVYAGSGSGTAFSYAYSDTTAPTLSASVSGTTQTATTLTATSSEAGNGYWIVVARNAPAPTPAQVKAGTAYSGVSIVAFGSGAMTATLAKAFSVSGLTAASSYDLYVTAEDASANLSVTPILVTFTTNAPTPAPTPAPDPQNPIPGMLTQPYVPGIGSQPGMLNMSDANGPAMIGCLMDALGQALGGNPAYQGQASNGGVRVAWNGHLISFYLLGASVTSSQAQASGINLQNANILSVATACGTFSTAPALNNLNEIGAILSARGLYAQINPNGVITVGVDGTFYVVRPDYLVTPGTPGAPSLLMGADGLFRFTDSSGNSQIMLPAFLDTDALQNQLNLVLGAAGSTMSIQTDGTATLIVGGQQYILLPDLTLGTTPPEHAMDYWWQDGPNHYSYRIGLAPYSANSQGFTLKTRN